MVHQHQGSAVASSVGVPYAAVQQPHVIAQSRPAHVQGATVQGQAPNTTKYVYQGVPNGVGVQQISSQKFSPSRVQIASTYPASQAPISLQMSDGRFIGQAMPQAGYQSFLLSSPSQENVSGAGIATQQVVPSYVVCNSSGQIVQQSPAHGVLQDNTYILAPANPNGGHQAWTTPPGVTTTRSPHVAMPGHPANGHSVVQSGQRDADVHPVVGKYTISKNYL